MIARLEKSTVSISLGLILLLSVSLQVLAAQHTSLPDSEMSVLEPILPEGAEWKIEIVDSLGDVGYWSSIAVDSHNNPHISYYDQTNVDLKYANWTGHTWGNWTVDSTGFVGQWNSIALDSKNYPHISYHRVDGRDLKYARWNGSAWSIETVDSALVGQYTSLALDSNDYPHISYYDLSESSLSYARWNGSVWALETVDDDGGKFTSIALDSQDNPHISYSPDPNVLRIARKVGDSWNIEDVATNWSSVYTSIGVDSHDSPHISFYANTDALAYARKTGDLWDVEIIDTPGVGSHNSLALDSYDHPHISYLDFFDANDNKLKYANWNGTDWNIYTVESGDVGMYTSIAVDGNNNPHITYHDRVKWNLKYATVKRSTPSRSLTLDIDPDTLNLKSKGRWIAAYLTSEDADVRDIDVPSLLLNDVVSPARWDIQNETVLMVKFDRAAVQAILPVSNAVDIKVTGQWKDGEAFELHDTIRVIDIGGHRESPWSIHSREGPLSYLGMGLGASSTYMEIERLQISLSEIDMSAISVAPDGKERLFRQSSKVRSPESCLYRASSIAVPLI